MKTMSSKVRMSLAMLCALLYFLETQEVIKLFTLFMNKHMSHPVTSPKPVEQSSNQQAQQHEDEEHGGGVHACRSTTPVTPHSTTDVDENDHKWGMNAPPVQASSGLNQQKLSLEGLPPGKTTERLSGLRPPNTPALWVGASECVATSRSPSLSSTTYLA